MASSEPAIALRFGNHTHISRDRVHFAFGSGRFSYDCVTCGAKCCRGYGYLLSTPEELSTHLARRPAIRLFLDPGDGEAGTQNLVKNCPPSCFFLNERSLCSIHSEFGKTEKPETCRLFPFNYFRRVGDHLIVGPHTWLCPLEVVPYGQTSEDSDHEVLMNAMSDKGIGVRIPAATAISSHLEQLVALERAVVHLSETHPLQAPYVSFASAQLELTEHFLAESGGAVPSHLRGC